MRVALLIALILAAAAWPLWLHAAQALVKPLSNHLSNRSQSVHASSIHGAESRINPTLKQKGPTA